MSHLSTRIGIRRGLVDTSWLTTQMAQYESAIGTIPMLIADFNRWKFALPAGLAAGDIAGATQAQLQVLREASFSEIFSFVASSTAARTYTDPSGILRSDLAADQPRVDWSYGKRQLYLNNAIANLFTYSEDFTQAAWTKSNCSVTPAAGFAQTGLLEATKVITTNALSNGHIRQNVSMTSGTSYTGSIFAASAGYTWLYVFTSDGTTTLDGWVNLATGATASVAGGLTITVTPAAFGAWRVAASRASGATATGNFRFYPASAVGVTLGNGTDGVFMWGAQCEAQAFASGYIKTDAATVTRQIETARFSTLVLNMLNRSSITIAAAGRMLNPSASFPAVVGADAGKAWLSYAISSGQNEYWNGAGGVASGASVANPFGVAGGFNASGAAVAANLGTAGTTATVMPAASAAYLGRCGTVGSTRPYGDGWYDRLVLLPVRIGNLNMALMAKAVSP